MLANTSASWLGMSLFCFYRYPLCYAAVLLKFTYCAQYDTQEQEMSDYYAFYKQFCMSNSLHVTDNSIKTGLLECNNERYQSVSLT